MTREETKLERLSAAETLAARINDPETRCYYLQLQNHPIIGPTAPGDGDLIEWVFRATCMVLYDFIKTDRVAAFDRQDPAPPPLQLPEGCDIFDGFRLMGLGLFYSAYAGCKTVPHVAWLKRQKLLEKETRRLWGGRRVRINKKRRAIDAIDPVEKVKKALQSGVKIKDIPAATGLSRATVYRILKRPG